MGLGILKRIRGKHRHGQHGRKSSQEQRPARPQGMCLFVAEPHAAWKGVSGVLVLVAHDLTEARALLRKAHAELRPQSPEPALQSRTRHFKTPSAAGGVWVVRTAKRVAPALQPRLVHWEEVPA
jgi:hypothetical protein